MSDSIGLLNIEEEGQATYDAAFIVYKLALSERVHLVPFDMLRRVFFRIADRHNILNDLADGKWNGQNTSKKRLDTFDAIT